MKSVSLLSLLCAAAAQSNIDAPVMPIVDMAAKYPKIANEFIVVFHPGTEDAVVASHMQGLKVADHKVASDFHIQTPNKAKEFRGYSVVVSSQEAADALANDPAVKYVEQNAVVRSSAAAAEAEGCVTQLGSTWGITRTSEYGRTSAGLYSYSDELDGAGVTAYIIDTGIAVNNVEFEGRASWGADFASNPSPGTDLNGHGTHVAGTVCGKLYGVAKKAECVGVAVLGPTGSGSTAGVVNGITWSAQQASSRKGKAIGNMSLGGGKSNALNDAVDAAYSAGFPMIVAAGNEYQDSCNVSPASATNAYTVMSSDSGDRFSSFSNYGTCSDIIAPGSGITAAWIGNNNAINTISGTSMAAPHVAGVGAKLLSGSSGMEPADLFKEISSMGTTGKISSVPTRATTLNLNLHMACDGFAEHVTKQSLRGYMATQ
jgi:subtilisin family serine protease